MLTHFAELIRLFELTGQPVAVAVAVLHDVEVNEQLQDLYVYQQAIDNGTDEVKAE